MRRGDVEIVSTKKCTTFQGIDVNLMCVANLMTEN